MKTKLQVRFLTNNIIFKESIASKKDSILDLIWDKKLKLNSHKRTNFITSTNSGANQPSLLGKTQEGFGIKREINLLTNRLDKIFSANPGKK